MMNIYVGNLPYSATEEELRTAFAAFGEVSRVNLITDRDTGRPKGFAFVEMATDQAAQAAISGSERLARIRLAADGEQPRESGDSRCNDTGGSAVRARCRRS